MVAGNLDKLTVSFGEKELSETPQDADQLGRVDKEDLLHHLWVPETGRVSLDPLSKLTSLARDRIEVSRASCGRSLGSHSP